MSQIILHVFCCQICKFYNRISIRSISKNINITGLNLPTFTLNLTDLYSLEITEANRNSYTAVIVEWQNIEAGKVKSIKVGGGAEGAGSGNSRSQDGLRSSKKSEIVYKMHIAQPKSDNEAFKQAEAKLNECSVAE